MYEYEHPENIEDAKKYVYGSESRDRYFLRDSSNRRFAHLTRKALMHYAGEHYNPHTVSMVIEIRVRSEIRNLIENKIMFKIEHDWVYIDNYLKWYIGSFFNLDLPFDKSILINHPIVAMVHT